MPVRTPAVRSQVGADATLLLLLLLLLHQVVSHGCGGGVEDVGLAERISDTVQFRLQCIEVGVKPLIENLIDSAELQFAEQPSGELFCVIAEAGIDDAGDAAQSMVQFRQAESHGAWKVLVQHEEFSHQTRMDLRPVNRFVCVPAAAGAQNGRPFKSLALADARGQAPFRQSLVAHVKNARGFVRALDELSRLSKPPTFVANECGVAEADELQRTGFDMIEELAWTILPIHSGLGARRK